MKIRKLGNEGLNVSAIGFGAMSITGFFGPTDDKTSQKCLASAYDNGTNFLIRQMFMDLDHLKN